jgi:hypothetical protein
MQHVPVKPQKKVKSGQKGGWLPASIYDIPCENPKGGSPHGRGPIVLRYQLNKRHVHTRKISFAAAAQNNNSTSIKAKKYFGPMIGGQPNINSPNGDRTTPRVGQSLV